MSCFTTKHWHHICRLYTYPPRYASSNLNPHTFFRIQRPSIATVWSLQAPFPNRNTLARKASPTDVAVANALYADLDIWATIRREMLHSKQCHAQLDLAIALLARRLAEPAIVDTLHPVPNTVLLDDTERNTPFYLNLDSDHFDLDQASYQHNIRLFRHRALNRPPAINIKHMGDMYVRISSHEAPFESADMRTLGADITLADPSGDTLVFFKQFDSFLHVCGQQL